MGKVLPGDSITANWANYKVDGKDQNRLIQYGSVTGIAIDSTGEKTNSVTFGTAFDDTPNAIIVTLANPTATDFDAIVYVKNVSASGFDLVVNVKTASATAGATVDAYWMAIGKKE